jgi:NADPH:quinone reductase-like Zn-dependent oxidoreductase
LSADGRHVVIGGPDGPWLGAVAHGLKVFARMPFSRGKLVTLLARNSPEDLKTFAELMSSGKVTPVIDRRYPLEETAAAMRHLETGHASGKVVVTVR